MNFDTAEQCLKERQIRWERAMRERGHDPILEDGELNYFAYEAGGCHNGPACSRCGWGTCWHCNEEMDIPDCDHHR